MSITRTGRPSIFRNKKHRVQGLITSAGKRAFERHRRRLHKMTGKHASDSDVIDYLALGPEIIRRLLTKPGGTL